MLGNLVKFALQAELGVGDVTRAAMRYAALSFVIAKLEATRRQKVRLGEQRQLCERYWHEFEQLMSIELGAKVTCIENQPGHFIIGHTRDKEDQRTLTG